MDKRKAKILVSDDEEVSRQLLHDFLSDIGYEVETAPDGEVALNMARGTNYDLLITDIRMPGMTGIELIQSMRQVSPETCFIVITGFSSIDTAIAAVKEGAYDYISKPFNLDEMKIIVERAIERQNLLKEAKEKDYYRELSILDGLTQVYNNRYFHELLMRESNRAMRYPQVFSLAMIDVDDFKKFNDSFGHLSGDCALKEVAMSFASNLRKVDLVSRFGVEEFAIIMPHTNKQGALIAAVRLKEAIERLEIKDEKNSPIGRVTVSIGVASFPEDGQTKEELIKAADEALYKAKSLGKNQVVLSEVKVN